VVSPLLLLLSPSLSLSLTLLCSLEKLLRDAAALEVAVTNHTTEEDTNEATDENPSKKLKFLTSEEKTIRNREKNREHARNTRRRKKIFVSKLKEMVERLTQQKDFEKRQRVELGKRIAEGVRTISLSLSLCLSLL
jgi:RNase P/RNase MRP subunit p30